MNREIDLTYGLTIEQSPQNCIKFGNFDSKRFRLHLHERMAVTPNEKEVLSSIPYRQGSIDVSNLMGHRVYENREITYIFYRFGVEKHSQPYVRDPYSSHTARDFQTTIENLLMREFDQRLEDSYEPDFHYTGKCREVIVTDEFNFKRLRVEIIFDLYPFKIDNHMESADLFDPFNFDLDAFQDGLSFDAASGSTIRIYNNSQMVLTPHVSGGALQSIPAGAGRFKLQKGINEVRVESGGTIQVDWRKERI